MTNREVVLEQIHHHETDRVPYTLGFNSEVAERLDEHYGDATWRERIERYIIIAEGMAKSEDLIYGKDRYRDPFGIVWRTDEATPSVVQPALIEPSFDGYEFPSVKSILDSEAIAKARATVDKNGDAFTIAGTGICLWKCWYLRGFETALMDVVAEEEFFTELLDRMTNLTLGVIDACREVPTDGIMVADDWGNQRGIFVGPDRWRKLYKPRYEKIFEAIHAQGKITLAHSCGSVAEIMGDLIEIGLDVIESVQPEAAGMNPYGLKEQWGDKITFWGGLGSQSTIPFGTEAELRGEIRRLRKEMSRGGGYILAPAKPVRTETSTANAIAVLEEFLA